VDNCIFCKIVKGEIPSIKLHEDDRTYAFMDINPGTRGHSLVIPKAHAADIHDIGEEDLAAVIKTVQKVAKAAKQALGCTGVNLVQSSGATAFQSVFHLHFHVIPRTEGDSVRLPWTPKPGDKSEIAETAKKITQALR
jgi:histidine triad (HIT) family protein